MIVGFGEKTIEMLKNAATSASFFFSLFMNSWISAISVHLALLIRLWLQLSFLWECSRWGGVSRLDPSDSSDGCTHQDTEPNPRLDLILYHAGANQNKTHRSSKLVFMRLFTTKPNPNRGFSLSNLTPDACLRCLFYHLGRLILLLFGIYISQTGKISHSWIINVPQIRNNSQKLA